MGIIRKIWVTMAGSNPLAEKSALKPFFKLETIIAKRLYIYIGSASCSLLGDCDAYNNQTPFLYNFLQKNIVVVVIL